MAASRATRRSTARIRGAFRAALCPSNWVGSVRGAVCIVIYTHDSADGSQDTPSGDGVRGPTRMGDDSQDRNERPIACCTAGSTSCSRLCQGLGGPLARTDGGMLTAPMVAASCEKEVPESFYSQRMQHRSDSLLLLHFFLYIALYGTIKKKPPFRSAAGSAAFLPSPRKDDNNFCTNATSKPLCLPPAASPRTSTVS